MKMRKMELLVLLLATALIAGTVGAQDITTGLTGYWPFNEGSGETTADMSGNGNNGTLINGAAWGIGPKGFGGALELDGQDDYVDCGSLASTTTRQLTISAWLNYRREGADPGRATMVANRTKLDDMLFQFMIRTHVVGGVYYNNRLLMTQGVTGDGTAKWCWFKDETGIGAAEVPQNEWVHVVVTCDGDAGEATAYINGEFMATDLFSLPPAGIHPLLIGWSTRIDYGAVKEQYCGLIDEVRLYDRILSQADIALLMATDTAVNPSPANEAELVPVDTNLSWGPPPVFTPSKYDLRYKAGDPNLASGATVVTDIVYTDPCNMYDPPVDFAYDTTVYWRVDSYYSGASDPCVGDVWSFTTMPEWPVITEEPCSLTVAAGDTAVFRVKDINGVSYTWKKQSTGLTVGTGSVLTLTNVQKDPCEDFYRCIVVNNYGEDTSAWAGLWTKRLVARWEFEDDLEDSEADGWDGDYTDPNFANDPPTPVFVLDPCSIDGGKALQLTADELHVRISDSEDYFNFYPQGYTVNAWVKTEQVGVYGCIASKQYRGESHPTDSKGWVLNCTNTGKAVSSLRQVDAAVSTTDINDNQWHMVTGTYDAEAGVVAVYVDGKLETESEPGSNVAPTNDYPMVLGAETVFAELAVYEGLLDKASIYSYALDQVEVAMLYTGVMTDEKICLGLPENDFNGDCRVDLLDFAMLSTGWLECNLVPECMP